MCYSPKTFVAGFAGCLVTLFLTACGGGGHLAPEVAMQGAPRPLVPIETKILFVHYGSSMFTEAYVMDGDGEARTQLAAGTSPVRVLDVTFDGQTALLMLDGNLFTMNVDGSGSRRYVLTGPGRVMGATFSPNGTQILYWADYDFMQHVYVVDLNAGRPTPLLLTRLFSDGAWQPRFNHNGSRIVFASHTADETRLWTINADGTAPFLVTKTPLNRNVKPSFNHDGTMICYRGPTVLDREGGVHVIHADGTDGVRLTPDSMIVGAPVFGADGTRVFFTSRSTGDWEIYSMSLTGTDLRNVTNRPDTNESGIVITARGQQILFTSVTDDGQQIMAMNGDGSGQTVLSRGAGYDDCPIVPGGRR